MNGFAIDRFGDEGALHELPVPEIGDDELLVRVVAAGVNPLDLKVRDGAKAPEMVRFPFVLGQDAAGVVERAGRNVRRFVPGNDVYGAFWMAGAFAQFVRVPMRAVVAHKPAGVSFVEAAALPTPGLAASAAIRASAPEPHHTVLIIGATGGVGGYAVQLAAASGARVVATGRSDAEARLTSLGASEVIDYTAADLVDTVRSRYPSGIDAVIDVVSDARALERLALVVRKGGHVTSTIHAANFDTLQASGVRAYNVDVFGSTEGLDDVTRFVDAGTLDVTIERTFRLEDAGEALATMKAGHARGKIVLTIE